MMTRRNFLKSTVLTLALAACGGTSAPASTSSSEDPAFQKALDFVKTNMPAVTPDLLRAAKSEGKFVFYHGQTGSDDAMLADFQKIFPFIAVESVTLSGGNLVERFMSEYRASKYLLDVVSITSLPAAAQAQKEGFVMAYTPGPASEIPASHTVPGYVYSHYSSVMGIGWNPEKMKDDEAKSIFSKWEGLADPRLQGKKFALNSDISGGSLQVLYTFEYKQFGTSLWQKMASNYNLFPGSPPIADAIISGEADIAAGLSAETMQAKWDKGAPIHWSYPEPVLALPLVEFIGAKAPHPNAAKVFVEYTFSLPSLSTYVSQGALTDRKGVPDNRKVKSEPWFSPPDTTKLWTYTTDDILTTFPEVTKAWNGLFKK